MPREQDTVALLKRLLAKEVTDVDDNEVLDEIITLKDPLPPSDAITVTETADFRAIAGYSEAGFCEAAELLAEGLGTALRFGGNDYVTLGDVNLLDGLSQWTMEAHFTLNDTVGQYPIVSKWNSGTTLRGLLLDVYAGKLRGIVGNGNGEVIIEASITAGRHTAALVKDATQIHLYIDGVYQTSGAHTWAFIDNTEPLAFGGKTDNGAFTAWHKGEIFEVRTWNTNRTAGQIADNHLAALTGSEVNLIGLWRFNETSGSTLYDATANGRNGTIVGAAWITRLDSYPAQADVESAPGDVKLYRPTLTFSRASVAYNPETGAQVASGTPRYVRGRDYNWLTATQSDFEAGTTGWSSFQSGSFQQSADYAWEGAYSLKVWTTVGGVSRGVQTSLVPVKPSTAYVASLDVRGAAGGEPSMVLGVYFYDASGNYLSNTGEPTATLSAAWQRFSRSFTTPANAAYVRLLHYRTQAGNGEVWHIDGVALQEGTVLLDWRLGGTGQAVLVEEAVTPLISNSDVEVNTTGWGTNTYAGSGSFTRDTATGYLSSASLKIQSTATSSRLAWVSGSFNVVSGQTYTVVVWAKATSFSGNYYGMATAPAYDNQAGSYKWLISTTDSSGTWKQLKATFTAGFTGTLQIRLWAEYVHGGTTVWFDRLQVWNKAYEVSWSDVATAAETLTLPTTGMSPTEGCARVWVYVNSVVKRQDGNYNLLFDISRSVGDFGIVLMHGPSTAEWFVQSRNDAGASSITSTPDSATPDGWHLFEVKWTASLLKLFIDGTYKAQLVNPNLPSGFGLMHIGKRSSGIVQYANTSFDDFHALDYYPTDQESADYYASTAPAAPTADTVALVLFDGSLTALYPSEATITTVELDLGASLPTRPVLLFPTLDGASPAGTSATVARYRMKANPGDAWGAWETPTSLPSGGYLTLTAPLRYIQMEVKLITTDTTQTPILIAAGVFD